MAEQPELSQAEWNLVIELLERERGDLPAEVRHTRTSRVRDDLRHREQMIEQLLQRLRAAANA